MSRIITNDVVDGIVKRIVEISDDICVVYDEDLPQGFTTPLFNVVLLNAQSTAKLAERYWREYEFDVYYFPKNERGLGARGEMLDIASSLVEGLEYIKANGDLLRYEDVSYEIVDNVLHFMVSYKHFVRRLPDLVPKMEHLETNERVVETE